LCPAESKSKISEKINTRSKLQHGNDGKKGYAKFGGEIRSIMGDVQGGVGAS